MAIDTKRLRELAEKATPGPWVPLWETDTYNAEMPERFAYAFQIGGVDHGAIEDLDVADADYIAATGPQAVLALLDEIDRLRGAIREALDFEAALPAIATVPHKILTDALEAEGGETND